MDGDARELPDLRFEVLIDDDPGRAQWRSLIDRLPPAARDIHFLPEYGAVYRFTYGHQPFLAVLRDGPRCVVQPFVKRPLNDLPFLREQGISEPYYDIASPYGYGGPVLCGDSALDGEALLAEF